MLKITLTLKELTRKHQQHAEVGIDPSFTKEAKFHLNNKLADTKALWLATRGDPSGGSRPL